MDFLLGYTTGSICEIRKEDMDANRGCILYVGDARLKTHYPHGQMHVVAPHLRIGSAVQRLVSLFRVRSEALGQKCYSR